MELSEELYKTLEQNYSEISDPDCIEHILPFIEGRLDFKEMNPITVKQITKVSSNAIRSGVLPSDSLDDVIDLHWEAISHLEDYPTNNPRNSKRMRMHLHSHQASLFKHKYQETKNPEYLVYSLDMYSKASKLSANFDSRENAWHLSKAGEVSKMLHLYCMENHEFEMAEYWAMRWHHFSKSSAEQFLAISLPNAAHSFRNAGEAAITIKDVFLIEEAYDCFDRCADLAIESDRELATSATFLKAYAARDLYEETQNYKYAKRCYSNAMKSGRMAEENGSYTHALNSYKMAKLALKTIAYKSKPGKRRELQDKIIALDGTIYELEKAKQL